MNTGIAFLNFGALGLGVLMMLLVGVNYPRLPERIPIHFGVTGEPDAWGPRETIWLLPLMGLASFTLLFGLTFAAGRDALLVAAVNLHMLALFLVITRDQMQVALGIRSRLSSGVWILIGTMILTSIAAAVFR